MPRKRKQGYIHTIIIFLLIQIIGWGLFLFLRNNNINYIDNFLITAGYFLALSVSLLLLFKERIKKYLTKPSWKQIFLIIGFFTITSIIYWALGYAPKTQIISDSIPKIVYLMSFDHRFILTKSSEILFQQASVLVFIALLREKFKEKNDLIVILLTIFPTIHLVNFFYIPFLFSTFFFIGAALASFIFPYIIIDRKNGIIYTYLLHCLYYLIFQIIFWLSF